MDLVLVAALALALGILLGYGAGAVRTLRLEDRRRAAANAGSAIARIFPEAPPTRTPADILAGRIRITLGSVNHVLPVLPRRAARAWLESLDERFRSTAELIEAQDVDGALRALMAHTDAMYDLLVSYAAGGGVELPVRDSEFDMATDTEILRATLEVWSALHPLAVGLVSAETSPTPGSSPASMTSSPESSGGEPATLTTSSPTSSSSLTSMPPLSVARPMPLTSSTSPSKRPASDTSSRATSASTAGGRRVRVPTASSMASPAPRSSRP